jgi:sulfite reductase (ferredoxin)
MADNAPSKIETLKTASHALRGTLRTSLDSDATHFDEDEKQLLKFHGIYQQDDRDLRITNRKAGLDKAWSVMIRLNIPGGQLSAEQYLQLDDLADAYANGSLRITTRQSIQYHGVIKSELRETIARINDTLLTTLAACGDVQRNVMAVPAPIDSPVHRTVRALAMDITRELLPRTSAYHEIWIDGERQTTRESEEPFYGETYLPRKFKTGIALDIDNSVDVFAYDCGLLGITEGDTLLGFNVLAGGGFGMTHNKPDTFARLATPIAFVQPEDAVAAVRAVATVYRDLGNRTDRRHARVKYLIESLGLDRFREAFGAALDRPFEPPRETATLRQHDYIGRHDQGDGRQFYGVFVQNGRIQDTDDVRIRSALRAIAQELRPSLFLTPMQSIIAGDLAPSDVDRLEEILREHGVATAATISNARRFSLACPALPTCGLALAESERVAPDIFDAIGNELDALGLGDLELNIRMTGCPNGCARPYNADIGLVGRRPGVYHLFVGGGLGGDRLADLFAPDVATDDIVATLRPLLQRFRDEHASGESLSDFYQRILGCDKPRLLLTGREEPTYQLVQVNVDS